MKIDIGITSTGYDLFKKINSKLQMSKSPEIDVKNKIFKIKNLCEYIFDLGEPLGLFSNIIECLKNGSIPELIVIDNPYNNKIYEEIDDKKIKNNKEIFAKIQLKNDLNDSKPQSLPNHLITAVPQKELIQSKYNIFNLAHCNFEILENQNNLKKLKFLRKIFRKKK